MSARGVALCGLVRPGGGSAQIPEGAVLVDGGGRITHVGPERDAGIPDGVRVVRGAVVMHGVVDAHVHLAFGSPAEVLAGGCVAVRDLGAPPTDAWTWQTARPLVVAASGPLVTAPGGYPSRSWGAGGFAAPAGDPAAARSLVARLVDEGADVVELALEPSGGPVPDLAVARAVVDAAHAHGRAVTCHALCADMVVRALDAGVDELCHVPVEPLPREVVDRIAGAGIGVVSTIEVHASLTGTTRNAAALVAAGVPLRYGTDLGNAGTFPGVDPRELRRLAEAGLGLEGALVAATETAAAAPGFGGRVTGRLLVGTAAAAVVLAADPVLDPWTLRSPLAMCLSGELLVPGDQSSASAHADGI